MGKELTISQVAKLAGCHRNTIINYERRGHIHPFRDFNNFRRYPIAEALKLKDILTTRKGGNDEHTAE